MTNKMPVVGQHYKLLRPATGSYYGNFKPLSHVRTFNEHFEVRELKIGEYLKLNEVFKFAYGYRAQFLATDGFGVNFKFNTYSPKSDREYSENSWDYFFEELPEDSLQKAGYIDKAEIWKLLDYNKKYKEKNSNKIVKLNSIGTAEVMFRYEGKNYNEGEFNKCSPSSFLNFFQELPEDSLQEKEEVQEVASKYFNVAALKANATALWNDFRFKKDYRFEEPADNEPKVNGTHNPVDFEKIEVNEKEQDFIHAFTGDLIEYQGKRYVCAFETDYLPNERAEDWKQTDYSSPQYKHKKIKFRDLFAKKEINEVEMALEKLKLKLKDDVWCESQYHYELLDLIKNLINALDNQKNENSYHDAISQYPKGVKAHSLYPYKPCKCCSDPEVYAEYMSKPEPKWLPMSSAPKCGSPITVKQSTNQRHKIFKANWFLNKWYSLYEEGDNEEVHPEFWLEGSKQEPKIDIKKEHVDPEIEIGSRWRSVDGKVVTIDFVKNDLVVWTYEFNDREQITLSTNKEFFIKDFKELKKNYEQ